MRLLEELATNTSLKSHFHLIQWLVQHLHLVFQTKGLALYTSATNTHFTLETCRQQSVAYFINVSPLATIMKPENPLFHDSKCMFVSLIRVVD